MKKILLLIPVILFSLASCEKEDPDSILGTWEISQVNYLEYGYLEKRLNEQSGFLIKAGDPEGYISQIPDLGAKTIISDILEVEITFNSDNTCYSDNNGVRNEGTYSLLGDEITLVDIPDFTSLTINLDKNPIMLSSLLYTADRIRVTSYFMKK